MQQSSFILAVHMHVPMCSPIAWVGSAKQGHEGQHCKQADCVPVKKPYIGNSQFAFMDRAYIDAYILHVCQLAGSWVNGETLLA